MAITFTEAKVLLDEIAQRTTTNSKRIAQAGAQLSAAQGDLAAMQTAYSAQVTEINAQVAANPDDPAWQALGAERTQLQSDFVALKTTVDAKKAAFDAA